MQIADLISWLFKLKFLEGYRTKVGAAALVLAPLLGSLQSPEVVAAFPVLEQAPMWLWTIGTYLGVVGARYKDDSAAG